MKTLLHRFDLSYLYVLVGEATLALTFVFYMTIARVLGPERYEIFSAAVALGAILSLFIQFGFPTLITREVAANPIEGPKSTGKFLIIEGLSFLLVLLLLFPLARLLGYQGEGLIVCYLVIFAELCRSVKMTQRGVLKGMGWFRSETISVAIERFFTVLLPVIVLFLTQNLVLVVGTFVLVRLLDIVGMLVYLSRKTSIWSPLSLNGLWQSVRMAYPFALAGVLWILYYQIDVVMLKGLAPTGEAGYYSAAYRILEMFAALPQVVFYVAFTRFARYYANEPEKLPEQIYKCTRLLLAVVLPTIVVAGLFQSTLVNVIYGEAFAPSVKPLAILLPSLSVKMFGTLVQKLLQATGREKQLPTLLFGTTMTNVVTNLILIPYLGGVGAAVATLLSELVLCLVGLSLMKRMQYKGMSKRLGMITAISLLVTAIPSLMLYGLTPIMGIGLMVPSIATMMVLMKRDRFLERVT
ncbi:MULTISPECIES: flippase [unclassified Coleofasciculus]|uniref:flippase n=1 Tax=unclassified Coleofasciculus TaxID=2692782 RepID=UPI00187F1B1C|nr:MULTISPECIES: flippase [unclassified Coleofasciculus]MBE9126144.1 flippase [Coleofasciculus sp. LEGE 07081]MBE9149562.1 flippase [Coleofasciculus sp. LEGE 07092]